MLIYANEGKIAGNEGDDYQIVRSDMLYHILDMLIYGNYLCKWYNGDYKCMDRIAIHLALLITNTCSSSRDKT